MSFATESQTVQKPFVRYAIEAGWTYLSPEKVFCLRDGEESPFLQTILLQKLQQLNPVVIPNAEKAREVLDRLLRVPPNIEGNLEAWEYLKGLKTVFVETSKQERNIRLLDTAAIHANAFHVTDEFAFKSGVADIRADVVLLVNGIPVVVLEAKAPGRSEAVAKGLAQIRRYHAEAPEFMAQTQLFAIADLLQFFYGPTWCVSRKTLFNWRDEEAGDFETLVKSFVAPRRLVQVLSDHILFPRKDGELGKAVLRPHQMRATEKALERTLDATKRRGLIWHTQGSGKTYTMMTLAKRLLEDPRLQNPTILMIVDRNELQQQLFQNLEAAGFGRVEVARSKRDLQALLQTDTRGIIVSMIHKFDQADANLCTRDNVIVLVDEAHRSTGGDLGNYLMAALPHATFLGFTGTPIDKTSQGKGTFKVFGGGDPKGYLDKYPIKASIEDGTTVPLHYQMAENDLLVDKETMEKEFWAVAELEGVADVAEINRVLEKAVVLKNLLKNPERVEKIARFVAWHFRETVEPMGYKAFLVAVDREACALYKEALDKILPPDCSQVIISHASNDDERLKRHHLSEEEEALARKAFRKPDAKPSILIVTEKLLTGYDAPILYAMYLDKPMRDHVLLQAIARVNRPYEDDRRRKTSGLVVDFVGIFDKLERALAFDSQDIEGVVEGIDVLKRRFERLMDKARRDYLILIKDKSGDKAIEAMLEHFQPKAAREAFYADFRDLQNLYEILSPDAFLRPFLEDYRKFAQMYAIVHRCFDGNEPLDRSFLQKTAQIVQQHTSTAVVREPQKTYEIGATALRALLLEDRPDTVKVFNLLKAMDELLAQESKQALYLISIGERADSIRKAFGEGQLSSQNALLEIEKLIESLETAKGQRQKSNLGPEAFAVALWLKVQQNVPDEKAQHVAQALDGAFGQHPHWRLSAQQERELRQAIYRALLAHGFQQNMVALTHAMLDLLRRMEP